ncbi:MAG: isoprenylcysteine carboxylmethyltransferase family protein [Opitutus sp.]|nr:isoprenylcysteine carboxylmethyltransferase family protein [Opitutus sp.]
MSPSTILSAERWRKPVSFFFGGVWLAAAVLTVPRGFEDGWHEALESTGFLLLIVAALGRLWAYAHIGGRKNQQLCCGGPYSLCRNPLYFFSFLGVTGVGLALQNLLLAGVVAGAFLFYYAWVIRNEEERLLALFGPAFATYCENVPRFWPKLNRPDEAGDLVISSRLFTRTLGEVFWFLAAIILVELIGLAKVHLLWPTIVFGY